MIQIKKISILLFIAIAAVACGGGDDTVPTADKFSISGSITIEDEESWIESQTVEIGLFLDDAIVPSYSIDIEQPEDGANIPFTFNNIEDKNYECKVYVAENGIHRADIYTFPQLDITEDINLSHANITLLTYTRLQDQLFDNCSQCHGGSSGDLAAELNLTNGNSYSNLVDVESTNSDMLRVASGDISNSFIIDVLNQNDLSFDHSASTSAKDSDIELVEMWIENGALNN